ncbi:MAG: rod shape-determining protein RodA [Polyangiaceae bacterium]|nr:rod shape-determining protein RodA [Polyangiaceae bacterium]MCW5790863.1 rod shape-determining protein RodA [Polyangiaceae bacterium]
MLRGDRVRGRDHFDWPLFLVCATIGVVGIVNLYSATSVYLEVARKKALADIYVSQVYWMVVGVLLAILASAIDYRHFERFAYAFYAVGMATLVALLMFGTGIRGAVRWVEIGSFTFQPSEFTKILLVLAVARAVHDDPRTEPRRVLDLWLPGVLTAIPFFLILRQPDLGTALVHVMVVLSIMAMTKVRRGSLIALIVGISAFSVFAWNYLLHDYQKARVTAFLDPEADKTGSGWHAFQSKTAIGNGGFTGQGFMQGTQNQFGFLPDQFSDFPFAVFAEDWGFVGSALLLALYAFLCIWAVHIASQAKDRFGAALAIGMGAIIFWHTLANIGMVLGVMPVTGITLPFFSYGGSSMLSMCIACGLLMNVSMRR